MRFSKLSILAFSAFISGGTIALATPGQLTNSNSEVVGQRPPDLRTISVLLTCNGLTRNGIVGIGGKTFRLSTGTTAGECALIGATAAACSLDGKSVAHAKCPDGCDHTARSGTCTQVN